jgi:hypothetical protein
MIVGPFPNADIFRRIWNFVSDEPFFLFPFRSQLPRDIRSGRKYAQVANITTEREQAARVGRGMVSELADAVRGREPVIGARGEKRRTVK